MRSFPWSRSYTTQEWLDVRSTHSAHRKLEPHRRARLHAAIGEAIDALGGCFEVRYDTLLVSARLATEARPQRRPGGVGVGAGG